MNYEIKEIFSSDFPKKLLKIPNAPKKLYAIGNIELLYKESFGIVGTRRITEYGKKVCEEFSKEFALKNIPVVSGMALGVDEIAHKTALDYEGETIAVIGSGFKYIYPEENIELFENIIENNGLILSEYPENTEKSSDNFPKRNRIIAALSEGVLVVEASNRSGSSITARWANEYGKKVFSIPGRIDDKMSVGANNLIKKYAILTADIDEIFEHYPQFANKKRKTIHKKQKNNKIIKNLKNEWKEIIYCLEDKEKSLEEIQIETQKSIREILRILTEMELSGIITRNTKMEYELLNK